MAFVKIWLFNRRVGAKSAEHVCHKNEKLME